MMVSLCMHPWFNHRLVEKKAPHGAFFIDKSYLVAELILCNIIYSGVLINTWHKSSELFDKQHVPLSPMTSSCFGNCAASNTDNILRPSIAVASKVIELLGWPLMRI